VITPKTNEPIKQDEVLELIEKALTSQETQEVDPMVEQNIADREKDRELKDKYANWFIYILIGQLLIMNLVFCMSGLKFLEFPNWALELYMGGTLAEVFGIVYVITNHLFPKRTI